MGRAMHDRRAERKDATPSQTSQTSQALKWCVVLGRVWAVVSHCVWCSRSVVNLALTFPSRLVQIVI